jgi:hypothetical protein
MALVLEEVVVKDQLMRLLRQLDITECVYACPDLFLYI